MLRIHFAQSAPVDIPRGHTTVAFTEPQIQAVLKTISDETVKSSLHAMRSLVLHAVHGGKGHTTGQLRKALIRGSLPARATSASSEGESDSEGYTTYGYTSGAYGTDEDIAGTILSQEVDSDASTSATQTLAMRREGVTSQSGDITIPSPGYSEGDYEPLCQMCPQTKHQHSEVSPPQKMRKLQPRPGKVMELSYFKGIQWTKVFVTGPLDPVHNKHKFYCQICKTNVSIYSKGAFERSSGITAPRAICVKTSDGDLSHWARSTNFLATSFIPSEEEMGTSLPRLSWRKKGHYLSQFL